jgi:CO/xanthine dehydrogenase Mo-binding subunit
MNESVTIVGQSVPRLEIREKVSGRAQYIADMNRPAMRGSLASPYAPPTSTAMMSAA